MNVSLFCREISLRFIPNLLRFYLLGNSDMMDDVRSIYGVHERCPFIFQKKGCVSCYSASLGSK